MRRANHSFSLIQLLITHLPKAVLITCLCLPLISATNSFAALQSTTCNQTNPVDKVSIAQKAFKLQVPFIANEGQIDQQVRFYAQTFMGKFYLTRDAAMVYTFSMPDSEKKAGRGPGALKRKKIVSIRERLIGASQISPQGIDPARAKISYIIGNDSNNWKTNIPTYNSVSLGSIYNGIDLSLRAYGDNVEKIFTVHPGADFSRIKINVDGATDLKINDKGELEINLPHGAIRFSQPRAYQENNGQKQPVQVAYRVQDNTYGFSISGHNPTLPLIIDPCLSYATYLGGAGEDGAFSVAVDPAGNAYVAGATLSVDFPTVDGIQNTIVGNYDGFVTMFDPDDEMVYSTYLGGELDDIIYAIAVDQYGSAYVTGETKSKSFPTEPSKPYDAKIGGNSDAFVAKISYDDTAGTSLNIPPI
jgi:hypothetical protein